MTEESFDVVVIGSGFGGAVTACRAAEADLRVLVLERGKLYRPGDLLRIPLTMSTTVWDPSDDQLGLFQIWSFDQLDVVVASGVGGGSLITKVMAPMAQTWFDAVGDDWPLAYSDIAGYYETVMTMMGAEPFIPSMRQKAPKAPVFVDAASRAGMTPQPAQLAVAFADEAQSPGDVFWSPDDNLHDVTYLSHAERSGAEIRPLHEVKRITAIDGGYELNYVVHQPADPPRERVRRPLSEQPAFTRVLARTVVVAAGALGSTWLLLSNRAGLPNLSWQLGTRFSGAGDAIGYPTGGRDIAESPRAGRTFLTRWRERLRSRSDSSVSAAVTTALGSSGSTLPLPAMGQDLSLGTLRLIGGRLALEWSTDGSRGYLRGVRQAMRTMARVSDLRLGEPSSARLSRNITAHPLGGCPMGKDAGHGVVNDHGEAFGHEGLFVADGSVLPSPVGADPSLTIAALAERFAGKIVERTR